MFDVQIDKQKPSVFEGVIPEVKAIYRHDTIGMISIILLFYSLLVASAFEPPSTVFKPKSIIDVNKGPKSHDSLPSGGGQNTISLLDTQRLNFTTNVQTALFKHEFIIGMVSAVAFAKFYPQVGHFIDLNMFTGL